jgi:Domain of unknown function (DUF5050)
MRSLALLLLTLAGCGARTSLAVGDCPPARCPSGQHWDAAACACALDPCPPGDGGEVTLATLSLEDADGTAVVVQAGEVYWTTRGGQNGTEGVVSKISRCGGSVTTLASNQVGPTALAVDATNVYWGNDGFDNSGVSKAALRKTPLGGGPVTQLSTDAIYAGQVATDGSDVYWTQVLGDVGLSKEPIGGGAPIALVNDQGFNYVFVDATRVYLSQQASDAANSRLLSIPTSGGEVTTLVPSGIASGGVMAIDATGIYYQADDAASQSADVVWISKSGGTPTVLVPSTVVGAMAVDGVNVYWTQGSWNSDNPDAIARVPVGGGAVTTLSSSTGAAIAVDDTYVYWLVAGDLRRMPK